MSRKSSIQESGASPKAIKANALSLWAQLNAIYQNRMSVHRQRTTEDFKIHPAYMRKPGRGRREIGRRPPDYRTRYSPKMNLTPGYKSIGVKHTKFR